jgi:hypothetical protein
LAYSSDPVISCTVCSTKSEFWKALGWTFGKIRVGDIGI